MNSVIPQMANGLLLRQDIQFDTGLLSLQRGEKLLCGFFPIHAFKDMEGLGESLEKHSYILFRKGKI